LPTFADRLKQLRTGKKLTQKTIAQAIDMTERAYQDLEYGKYKPNHDNIIKLADFFEVSADYLLGRSDNPQRQ